VPCTGQKPEGSGAGGADLVRKIILRNYSAQKREIRLFSRFEKIHLNNTVNPLKSIKRKKKDMPCSTTNIYIGL
jgi:hypothetical protein